jgi:hypothetical protein
MASAGANPDKFQPREIASDRDGYNKRRCAEESGRAGNELLPMESASALKESTPGF